MGRPRNHEREYYAKKLKWFKADRYENVKDNHLSLAEWYEQIVFRRLIIDQLRAWSYVDDEDRADVGFPKFLQRFLTLIQKDPIVRLADLTPEDWFVDRLDDYRQTLSRSNLLSVHPTTPDEFYLWEASQDRTFSAQSRRFFDELVHCALHGCRNGHGSAEFLDRLHYAFTERKIDRRLPGEPFVMEVGYDAPTLYAEQLGRPIGAPEIMEGRAFITIDLNASDSAILERVEKILFSLRRNKGTVRAPSFSTEAWSESGLLPYTDLQIWRMIDGFPEPEEGIPPLPGYVLKKLVYLPYVSENGVLPSMAPAYFSDLFLSSEGAFRELQVRLAEKIDQECRRRWHST